LEVGGRISDVVGENRILRSVAVLLLAG